MFILGKLKTYSKYLYSGLKNRNTERKINDIFRFKDICILKNIQIYYANFLLINRK